MRYKEFDIITGIDSELKRVVQKRHLTGDGVRWQKGETNCCQLFQNTGSDRIWRAVENTSNRSWPPGRSSLLALWSPMAYAVEPIGKLFAEGLETGDLSWLNEDDACGDEWRLEGDIIETGDEGDDDLDVTQLLIIAFNQLICFFATIIIHKVFSFHSKLSFNKTFIKKYEKSCCHLKVEYTKS